MKLNPYFPIYAFLGPPGQKCYKTPVACRGSWRVACGHMHGMSTILSTGSPIPLGKTLGKKCSPIPPGNPDTTKFNVWCIENRKSDTYLFFAAFRCPSWCPFGSISFNSRRESSSKPQKGIPKKHLKTPSRLYWHFLEKVQQKYSSPPISTKQTTTGVSKNMPKSIQMLSTLIGKLLVFVNTLYPMVCTVCVCGARGDYTLHGDFAVMSDDNSRIPKQYTAIDSWFLFVVVLTRNLNCFLLNN